MRAVLRVERRGAQQVAGKQTGCNLCAFRTRGAFPVFWIRRDNVLQGWVFFLMQCNGDKKNKPTLDFFNVNWNVEFKCLLTFFGQLAPLRVMPKTGTAPKPERLSRRAKHDAAVDRKSV